jgi:hypothetical protein
VLAARVPAHARGLSLLRWNRDGSLVDRAPEVAEEISLEDNANAAEFVRYLSQQQKDQSPKQIKHYGHRWLKPSEQFELLSDPLSSSAPASAGP